MSHGAADADLEVQHARIAFDERRGLAHQHAERHRLLAQRPRAREHQHVLHDPVEPVEARDDVDQNGAIALVGRHPRRNHLQRAANARDRVLHFVRDDRGHLAELGERFLFGQPLLEHDAIAQVVENSGEAALSVARTSSRRPTDARETSCRPCGGGDFAADADDLLLAGREVMVEIPVVALAIGARHQHVHVAAEHLADCDSRTAAPLTD